MLEQHVFRLHFWSFTKLICHQSPQVLLVRKWQCHLGFSKPVLDFATMLHFFRSRTRLGSSALVYFSSMCPQIYLLLAFLFSVFPIWCAKWNYSIERSFVGKAVLCTLLYMFLPICRVGWFSHFNRQILKCGENTRVSSSTLKCARKIRACRAARFLFWAFGWLFIFAKGKSILRQIWKVDPSTSLESRSFDKFPEKFGKGFDRTLQPVAQEKSTPFPVQNRSIRAGGSLSQLSLYEFKNYLFGDLERVRDFDTWSLFSSLPPPLWALIVLSILYFQVCGKRFEVW